MRCPNYTGFKPRVGGLAGARAPAGRAGADDLAEGLSLPERAPLGLHALGHDAVVLRELTPDAGDQAAAADRAG